MRVNRATVRSQVSFRARPIVTGADAGCCAEAVRSVRKVKHNVCCWGHLQRVPLTRRQRSKRRRSAGSRSSTRFVAASTNTRAASLLAADSCIRSSVRTLHAGVGG